MILWQSLPLQGAQATAARPNLTIHSHALAVLQLSQQIHELEIHATVAEQPDGQRSPSPQPQYNEQGVRTNTRAQRLKQKLTAQAQVGVFPHSTL